VELIEASLDNLPPYEALSYVWGSLENMQQIMCNGKSFQITNNLAKALRRLQSRLEIANEERLPGTESSSQLGSPHPKPSAAPPGLLWVDAICINQDCLPERSHQVSLMKEIYSKATRVYVWLGDQDPKDEDASAGVAAIQFVCSAQELDHVSGIDRSPNKLTISNLEQSMIQNGIFDNCQSAWNSLDVLFTSRWYRRVWCIQEVALARQVILLIGKSEMGGEDMFMFHMWYTRNVGYEQEQQSPRLTPYSLVNLGGAIYNINISRSWNQPLDILNLFSGREAKDPRDNIYGLLGLMDPAIFPVDYTLSVREVYTDAALQLIGHMQDLRVLSYVDHGSQFSLSPDEFPSWVPRWDRVIRKPICPRVSENSLMFAGHQEAPTADLTRAHQGSIRLRGLMCGHATLVTPVVAEISDEQVARFHAQDRNKSIMVIATTFTGGKISWSRWVDKIDTDREKRFLRNFKAAVPHMLKGVDFAFMDAAPRLDGQAGDAAEYIVLVGPYIRNRRFRTNKDWIGLGPACMQEGDIIVVFTGSPMPMILRPANNGKDQYYLMGESYIYDIAMGQAYDIMEKEGVRESMFELI
jgi:hypothetical protein